MSSVKPAGFEVSNALFQINSSNGKSSVSEDIYDLDLCTVNIEPPLGRQVTTGYSCNNTDCGCHGTQNDCHQTQNSCNQTNCC